MCGHEIHLSISLQSCSYSWSASDIVCRFKWHGGLLHSPAGSTYARHCEVENGVVEQFPQPADIDTGCLDWCSQRSSSQQRGRRPYWATFLQLRDIKTRLLCPGRMVMRAEYDMSSSCYPDSCAFTPAYMHRSGGIGLNDNSTASLPSRLPSPTNNYLRLSVLPLPQPHPRPFSITTPIYHFPIPTFRSISSIQPTPCPSPPPT